MVKIIDIKEFSYFLKVNRNYIVQNWFDMEEVKHILNKHSFAFIDKNKIIFNEFCDCFISSFEYDFAIEQCHSKISFLNLLKSYAVDPIELYNLILHLKQSIQKIIYENDYLSYSLSNELENITIKIANEIVSAYSKENFQDNDDYKNEQSNLLSEYKRAVDISNIVSKTNPKGIITYVNDKFCEISGYSRSELIGKPHNVIRHPAMPRESFKELWDTIKMKKPWNGIVTNMKKDGTKYIVDSTVIPILDVDGDVVEYIAVRHDITELEDAKEQLKVINQLMKTKVDELHNMTTSLEQQATIDRLTNIYNRDKFEELFDEIMNDIKYSQKELSLIIFDIDHFKIINDTYGHQAGDSVLRELGSLISSNIKKSDIYARWGGEEFVILLPHTNLEGGYMFAQKLRKLIAGHEFRGIGKLTASFGVGEYIINEDKVTLFEKVDKALYLAKNNGRNRVEKAIIGCAG